MTVNFEEKTLSSCNIYSGKIFDVIKDEVELSNGQKTIREVVKHPGGVVIVAKKDENTILMIKQFRYPTGSTLLELPAGKLEKGEDPFLAAKRELEEETGYVAKVWKKLGFIYPTPGFCDERLYLYFAKDLVYTKQNLDDGEILECFEYNIKEVFEMIKNGEINDSKTICALTRAFLEDLR